MFEILFSKVFCYLYTVTDFYSCTWLRTELSQSFCYRFMLRKNYFGKYLDRILEHYITFLCQFFLCLPSSGGILFWPSSVVYLCIIFTACIAFFLFLNDVTNAFLEKERVSQIRLRLLVGNTLPNNLQAGFEPGTFGVPLL